MGKNITRYFWGALALVFMGVNFPIMAQQTQATEAPSAVTAKNYVHGFGVEMRYAHVFPSKPFYRSDDTAYRLTKSAFSAHLRYGFYLPEGTSRYRVYGDTYWGIGLAPFYFGNQEELGNPVALYLYQGARIANLSRTITFNFEWNFGLSGGWQPYDPESNPNNKIVGSRYNAFINTSLLLKWKLSSHLDVTAGADLTHFSNGNTAFPNAGINMLGGKVGAVYRFEDTERMDRRRFYSAHNFPRHISYDVVLFGSWRRKGVTYLDEKIPSPHTYPVIGANIGAFYNVSYKFRTGISVDPLYDGSANVYAEDYIIGTEQPFVTPDLKYQLALGMSARAEFVMPVFTVGVGLGTNVLHKGGDFKGTYQVFS